MTSSNKRLYLASQSPRRAQLLRQINIDFELLVVEVDETPRVNEKAANYVERLAVAKAKSGWEALQPSQCRLPVLGADTSVVLDGDIMGKPTGKDDAVAMLKLLSAKTHQVMTAICFQYQQHCISHVVVTDVTFRSINEQEIVDYWNSGEPQDKAGGYAIQGLGAIFVEQIYGSYSAVVGLPLSDTYRLLGQIEQEVCL